MQVPGLRPGAPPQLHTLGEYPFQELCRDLFDAESEIATCEIYGTRGQTQDGIDLLAYRRNSDGIEVGQCKCYADFPPRQIREASQDFFDHWEHWSTENVRRFVLFVACDMSSRQRQDEIAAQRRRFAEHGITYEVWSVATIVNRLRPHRGIVATYFTPADYWVSIICGEVQSVAPLLSTVTNPTSSVLPAILGHQIETLAVLVSTETERTLAAMQQAAREGRPREALAWVEETRRVQERWLVLTPEVKARLLRFAAGLLLRYSGDSAKAAIYADEARELMPVHDDRPLRALIAAATAGSEAAIEIVEGVAEVEHRLIHAVLLLDLGHGQASRTLLDDLLVEHPDHPEALHLRALAHLITGNLTSARIDSQAALALVPTWHAVRFTTAVVAYFSALSLSAVPDQLVRWPEPIEWAFVRQDDVAQAYLREAHIRFHALAVEATNDERHTFETWALACLANDSERQEAALTYARTLLSSNPAHVGAIAWSLARSFSIDLRPSERALTSLVDRHQASIPQVLVLVSRYMSSNRGQRALGLVERVQPLFTRQGMETAWRALRQQVLLQQLDVLPPPDVDVTGDPDTALVVAGAMRRRVRSTGARRTLLDYLERILATAEDARLLLFWYEVLLDSEQWEQAADQAERLVTRLGTGSAVGLAAVALYNARRFTDCLQLLETHQNLFSGQAPPIQLRRIRGLSRLALGLLGDARTDIEMLVREDPSADHLLTLVQLHVDRGDYAGIALVARQLVLARQVPVGALLRIASLLQHDDPQLAITLWRKAEQAGFPDDAVGQALTLAFQLGLEGERLSLLPRMTIMAEQGLGQMERWNWDELTAFVRAQQEQRNRLEAAYLRAEAPIQIIAHLENIPLVEIFRNMLTRNAANPDPLRQPALLARHGGRVLPTTFSADTPSWRLHLDLTAVLLGAHLEILDLAANTFRSLHLPQDLVPALIQMREQLVVAQPELVRAAAQIQELRNRGALQVVDLTPAQVTDEPLVEEMGLWWYTLFHHAREHQGYFVNFLPLHRQDHQGAPQALPEGADQLLVNCRAIVEALRHYGPLSLADYERALDALGVEGQGVWAGPLPPPGALLIFHANTSTMLAESQTLEAACERFQVVIEQRELDRLRSDLDADVQRRELNQWLSALIRRLNDGIDSGTFGIIPQPPERSVERRHRRRDMSDVPYLETLLRFSPQEGDVIWCDDRTINAYQHRDGVPLIGVNEVLKALLATGALDTNSYYERLLRLRAGNVRFIPLEADEILHHLGQARVEAGAVIETRALRILRRSVAAALLSNGVLQRPPLHGAANTDGEIAWLHAHLHAVVKAIGEIWSDGDDEQHCWAQAEWVLNQLYLDHLAFHHLLHQRQDLQRQEPPGEILLAAPILGHLIMQSLFIDVSPERTDVRRRYLDWLKHRLLLRRFNSDPQLISTVTDMLKSALLGAHATAMQEGAHGLVRRLLATVFTDLPEQIADTLASDPNFSEPLHLTGGPSIQVGDLIFDPDVFWRAATVAVNGGTTTITTEGSTEVITFRSPDQPFTEPMIDIVLLTTGQAQHVMHPDFALLADSEADRLAALRRNLAWFDCNEDEREVVLQEVAACADPRARIDLVDRWRTASTSVYYGRLHEFLRNPNNVDDPGLLPPSTLAMLQHLRLNHGTGPEFALHAALQQAADDLIRTEGLAAAIERLSGLPLELPPRLQAATERLPALELRALVKHLLRTAVSPPAVMHILAILLRTTTLGQTAARLARRLISFVVGPAGQTAFTTFHRLLLWLNNELAQDAEQRLLPAHLRLTIVWSHAHRLFSAFIAAGVPLDVLRERFSRVQRQISPEIFDPPFAYWYDCTHPRTLQFEQFVLSGLSYALRGREDQVMTRELAERIWTTLFAVSDSGPIPSRALLRDISQAGDMMSAWMGGDPGVRWAQLFGDESAALFNSTALQAVLSAAFSPDEESQTDAAPWTAVQAILGDLPPYPQVAAPLATSILRTNFAELIESNYSVGLFALQVAAMQAPHLEGFGVIDYLRTQFPRVIAVLRTHHSRQSGNDNNQLFVDELPLLIDIAAHLARGGDAVAGAIRYCDLLSQLFDSWPALLPHSHPFVQRLCEELPLAQAQHFWRLLVRIRAE
jgi:tetratricopeptide (TPR) repeat protein